MDFEFTEEQRLVRKSLREFLEDEVEPVANERDKEGALSKEEIIEWNKKFKKLGIGFDPETAREFFSDPVFYMIFMEEVSRVWASLTPTIGYQAFSMFAPYTAEDRAEKLSPKLDRGELIGTIAVTEPEAGCDNRDLSTTAELDGDDYVLNGEKTWITNASVADVGLVLAVNEETGEQEFFFVDKDYSSWETSELHKIGWNACPTGEMFFDNTRVPEENTLSNIFANVFEEGEEALESVMLGGKGMVNLMDRMSAHSAFFTPMRTGMSLMATGISQACLDEALQYAKDREQFGKPIGKNQLIQEMIYEISTIVETSRMLGYKACDAMSRGDPDARRLSSMAKGYACEKCIDAAYNASQIHGATGLSEELPLERYYRDARMMTVPDGTPEIQKLVVAYELLGEGMSAYT